MSYSTLYNFQLISELIELRTEQFLNEQNYLKELASDGTYPKICNDIIQKILSSSHLNESPSNRLVLKLISDYFIVTKLLEKKEENQDEILSFWEKTEFFDQFLDEKINNEQLPFQLLQQAYSLFCLKNSVAPSIDGLQFNYLPVNEIGDTAEQVVCDKKLIKFSPTFRPSEIVFIPEERQILSIQDGLILIPICEEGYEKAPQFSKDIAKALNIIKQANPSLNRLFELLTHTIIPINKPGIVSFSQQFLPGISSINLFERDFTDLLDDLVHENGHHYLNLLLDHFELIIEDDDPIFYSPWRDALRPIRGLYHAVFTFFWAFELFQSLIKLYKNDNSLKNILNLPKIMRRASEELAMINACRPQVNMAFVMGKITDEGYQVINTIYDCLDLNEHFLKTIQHELKLLDPQELRLLEENLTYINERTEHYSLN